MKIDLYAKKIDSGHIKIGTVDVPDNFGFEYRLPVRPELSVISRGDPVVTSTSTINNYRLFRFTPSVIERLVNKNRMYLEQ